MGSLTIRAVCIYTCIWAWYSVHVHQQKTEKGTEYHADMPKQFYM